MLNNQSTKPVNTAAIRKLPARYTPIVFAFFMSAIMALLMCFVITAASNSLNNEYLPKVMHAYALAMPVAFVCILIVRPMVIKLVGLCVRS
jgi:hypothetical protein